MKPLPAHLPPLPAGAVYLGLGCTFKRPEYMYHHCLAFCNEHLDMKNRTDWLSGVWSCADCRCHYAAPADSEIARLNATVEPQSVCIVWSASRQEPTKTHPSRESAIAEAKRLCAKHPAHEFFVFERVAGFKGTVTVESIVP